MSAPVFSNYAEAAEYQLREWVEGRPWHNPWSPANQIPSYTDKAEGECCPDFSCCCPDMIWPRKKREAFAGASGEARYGMLIGALVAVTAGENVHVAGSEE